MGRKRHTPEQIITALREAEAGLARGKSVKLISREYGGMNVSQARRGSFHLLKGREHPIPAFCFDAHGPLTL